MFGLKLSNWLWTTLALALLSLSPISIWAFRINLLFFFLIYYCLVCLLVFLFCQRTKIEHISMLNVDVWLTINHGCHSLAIWTVIVLGYSIRTHGGKSWNGHKMIMPCAKMSPVWMLTSNSFSLFQTSFFGVCY